MLRVTSPCPRRPLRNGLLALAAAAALSALGASFALAAPRFGKLEEQSRPRLVAPAPGERLSENAITFAVEPPRNAGDLRVILLPRQFDPSAWSDVPANVPDLVVRTTKSGVVSFADLKLPLAQEGTWWWTVGARDPQGAWHFAPAQSFTAIPKFTNRVTSSPYLMRSLLGQMGAEDLRE